MTMSKNILIFAIVKSINYEKKFLAFGCRFPFGCL